MKLGPLLRSPKVEIGLAFRHPLTGAAWNHNDRRFPAGDLVRLPLAMATYHTVAQGRFNLWSSADKAARKRSGTGLDVEADVTVRELLHRMLARRDWQAAESLLALVGPTAVNETLAHWGLTRTVVQAPLQADWPSCTTPGEMAALLARLTAHDGITGEHAAELVSQLRLYGPGPLPSTMARRDDLVPLSSLAADHHHLCAATPHGQLIVILTEGPAAMTALSKMAATLDGFYAGVEQSEARVREALSGERRERAPDPRLVAWDLDVRWKEGGLEIVGRTSAPAWPDVVARLKEVSDVPVVDRVRQLTATPPHAIALAPVVHLRKAPAHAAEMVSQAPMGVVLDVLEAREDWWQVRAPDGTIAHVRSTNLQPATEHDATRWQTREQVMVTAPLLECRRLTHGAVLLSAGTRLALVGRRKDGILGRTPGREEVVVPESDCRILGTNPEPGAVLTRRQILDLAGRFIGVPYLWGGTSGWGVDCSGFTQLVFAMAGLQIPRDSDQQYDRAVQRGLVQKVADLQPCDLVFFPGHVGLYLGRGEFVHASAPAGCVTVNALVPGVTHYSSALARKFKGGGRLLDA